MYAPDANFANLALLTVMHTPIRAHRTGGRRGLEITRWRLGDNVVIYEPNTSDSHQGKKRRHQSLEVVPSTLLMTKRSVMSEKSGPPKANHIKEKP
jgi:hypothetical protein